MRSRGAFSAPRSPVSAALLLALCASLGSLACVRVGFQLSPVVDGAAVDAADGGAADSTAEGPDALEGGTEGAPDLSPDGPPASGAHLWSRLLGHAGGVEWLEVAVAGNGDFFVLGRFRGRVDLGGGMLTSVGASDILVARFSKSGAHLWSRRYGGSGEERGTAIAALPDGGLALTGRFTGTANLGGADIVGGADQALFVACYEGASGAHRWSAGYAVGGAEGRDIAAADGGNLIVTGRFSGVADLGGPALTSAGATDAFVVSYEGDSGAHRWSRALGGTGVDEALALAVDPGDGTVVVTGSFAAVAGMGGGDLTAVGGRDVFLASYATTDGAHRWSSAHGGPGDDVAYAAAIDASSNRVAVAGTFEGEADLGGGMLTSTGSADVFVACYEGSAGAHRWSRSFGGSGDDEGLAVAATLSGDVVITGRFLGDVDFGGGVLASAGGHDAFVASYGGGDGAHRWSRRFGGSGADKGHGIAAAAGAVFVTGRFDGRIDFGGAPLPGAQTAFIAALAP